MNDFYHLCFVVQDIERAASDLTRALGVTWSPVRDGRLGDWDYRIVFSTEGPPFFEVIQGPPGSPWDATAGSRFDHLGYWSDDVNADRHRLAGRGAPVEFDACPYGRSFTYHRLDSVGLRVELVDVSVQSAFLDTWSPGGAAMPTLTLDDDPAGTAVSTWPENSTDRGPSEPAAQCHAVLVDFLAAIDRGVATQALELFTPDASFDARGQRLHGHDQIRRFLVAREADSDRHTAHLIANEVVRRCTDDELELTALLLLHERRADGRYHVERVLDTVQVFRRTDDGWRIQHRATTPLHHPQPAPSGAPSG